MKTVLVIDDEPALRKTLRIALQGAGYRVIDAEDGLAGVKQFEQTHPDIVLVDMIMPAMEGVETIISLRKLRPDVRIVAMSGGGRLDATDVLRMADRFGTKATIAKPFRMAYILEIVRRLTEDHVSG
jgi:two-component system, chemotaxis family, chemotaxis protein CheY